MDFAGPYCTTKAGNRFVLVFVDWFTKWVEAVALPDQKAETVVKCFYDRIICRHGVGLLVDVIEVLRELCEVPLLLL